MVLSYSNTDVISFLKGKFIVFLGDSNMRAIYKDFLVWIQKNQNITLKELCAKGEVSFLGDKKLTDSKLTNGKNYEEIREYKVDDIHIRFQFVTRCYSEKIENFIKSIYDKKTRAPDAIVMNSCLWDISRWGPNSVIDYQLNMTRLMTLLNSTLPAECLFVWTTTPPISAMASGGFLLKNVNYDRERLQLEVIKGNSYCMKEVEESGYNTLDLYYYLSTHIDKQQKDGIHYNPDAVRYMNNLILQRLSLLFGARTIGLNIARNLKENLINTQKCIQTKSQDSPVKTYEMGGKEKIREIQIDYENRTVELNEKLKFMTNNSENYEETGWKEKIRQIQIEQENRSRELSEKLKSVKDDKRSSCVSYVPLFERIRLMRNEQRNWYQKMREKLEFLDCNRKRYEGTQWKEEMRQKHMEHQNWSHDFYEKLKSIACTDQKYGEEVLYVRKVEEIQYEHEKWSKELYKKIKSMIDEDEGTPWKERVEKMKIELQNWSRELREKLRCIADSNQNWEKEEYRKKVGQIKIDQENWSRGLNRKLKLMRERKIERYHPYATQRSPMAPVESLLREVENSFRQNVPSFESETRKRLSLSFNLPRPSNQPFRNGSHEPPLLKNVDELIYNGITAAINEGKNQNTGGYSARTEGGREFWVDSVDSNDRFGTWRGHEEFWLDSVENNADGFYIQREKLNLTEDNSLGDLSEVVGNMNDFEMSHHQEFEPRGHFADRVNFENPSTGARNRYESLLTVNNRRSRGEGRGYDRWGGIRDDRWDRSREMGYDRLDRSMEGGYGRWVEGEERGYNRDSWRGMSLRNEMGEGCMRTFGEDRRYGLFRRGGGGMDINNGCGPVRRSRIERYRYDGCNYRR